MAKGKKILLYSALTLIALFFLFTGLVRAQSFLVPLVTAMVLAFLMFPITNKLERWGIMGMVLSIPIFAMITVVCRHVPVLNPFGYLFSKGSVDSPLDEQE